jgi:photosystem II stability/assembly factor-like uncharacterized protein
MKKLSLFTVISLGIILFSGCSLSGSNNPSPGNFLKSTDGGKIWESKVSAGQNSTIAQVNVLSMAIDRNNTQVIFLGTKEDGIFMTKNGGELWEKVNFPSIKTYGLAIDPLNSQIIYASGVWGGRGKIYRSEDGGSNWKEIYTEPSDGTIIVSLEISPTGSGVVYAGTSEGAVFKTTNGGDTWVNATKASGAVTDIVFDPINSDIVYFLVLEQGIIRTKDSGASFVDLEKNIQGNKFFGGSQIFSMIVDPYQSGTLYAGFNNGILKSTDFGDNWNSVNILESSKEFPVKAMAINPQNSREFIYSAAQAVYKSIDSGAQWATTQLEAGKSVDIIKYDPMNPGTIFLGLRKAE